MARGNQEMECFFHTLKKLSNILSLTGTVVNKYFTSALTGTVVKNQESLTGTVVTRKDIGPISTYSF